MGDFHELVGDLTREQLNSDPYQCGVGVGRAVCERYPRLCHGQGLEEVGVCVRGCFKDGFTIPRVRGLATVTCAMIARVGDLLLSTV